MKKKMMIALLVLLNASASFATPKKGDYAKYLQVYTQSNGQSFTYTIEMTLSDYDATTDTFTQVITMTPDGTSHTTKVTSSQVSSNDNLISSCVGIGGTLSDVFKILGTSIPSCLFKVSQNGVQNIWMGQVPFNILKMEAIDSNGNKAVMTLVDFHSGS